MVGDHGNPAFRDVSTRPHATLTRRAVLAVAVAAGLAATVGPAPNAFASSRVRRMSVSTATPRLGFGIATPGGPLASAEIDEVTQFAGEAPRLVMLYKDFRQAPPAQEIQAALDRGMHPIVTWEPWVWGGGLEQPEYSMARIAAGGFEDYLYQWGVALAPFGSNVTLRFAHEMNGNWYPWCPGVNGTTRDDYIAAWHRVYGVVTSTGATPRWMWAPNAPYPGSTPLETIYPGDRVVDVLGLDAYNFGTSQSWTSWQSPAATFEPGLEALRAVAPTRSIVISETASSESGGSKPVWIGEAIAYLDAQADVDAFVWFHFLKESDWRINSSAESAAAFNNALQSRSRF